MNLHDLRIILKIATGQSTEFENGTDIADLIAEGWIYRRAIGLDVSSTTLQKLERICQNWETI
jgi:hypothetical protein